MPSNEWSGPLMYTINGEFHSGEFDCEVKDIFPAAKGSAAYTEFEFSPDFIKYRMDNPDSLDWNVANVHSHNSMSVFFSGTDTNDLQENAKCHNYYLSLIVNNAGDMCAKIAFIGTDKITQDIVRTFNGDDGIIHSMSSTLTKEEEVLYVYDCDIVVETNFNIDVEFEVQVDKIIREYDAKLKAQPKNKFVSAKGFDNLPSLPFDEEYLPQDTYVPEYGDMDEGAEEYKIKPSKLLDILKCSLVGDLDYTFGLDSAIEYAFSQFRIDGGEDVGNIVMLVHNLITLEDETLDEMETAMSVYTMNNLLEDYNEGETQLFIEKLIVELESSVELMEA